MKLIRYENYRIVIADELLLIRQARQLLNADRTADKENFLRQISYMYFMYDPESTYDYIVDEKERAKTIIEQEGLGEDFKPNKKLQELIEIYKEHTKTTSKEILNTTKITVDKIRKFLAEIDFSVTDDNGKPVYTVDKVTSSLKTLLDLAVTIKKTEKEISKEVEENVRARGMQEKKLFEDGIEIQ